MRCCQIIKFTSSTQTSVNNVRVVQPPHHTHNSLTSPGSSPDHYQSLFSVYPQIGVKIVYNNIAFDITHMLDDKKRKGQPNHMAKNMFRTFIYIDFFKTKKSIWRFSLTNINPPPKFLGFYFFSCLTYPWLFLAVPDFTRPILVIIHTGNDYKTYSSNNARPY